jgi:4-hydroxy-tetrahydrodipicolinate synthase
METDFIKGVIVPILTPIDANEIIDEKVLRRMVNHVIAGGVHGILLYGSNGEFFAVEYEELERGIEIVLDETKGRVPVYTGIGAITTSKCVKIAQMAVEKGVQGISVLQPMFIAPREEELYEHFKEVAESVPETAVLLYNNSARTHYNISANLTVRLNESVENVVGIKDSSGDMTLLAEYVRLTRHTNFKVLAGKDTLIYASLAQGAVGCVATTANFLPEYVTDIYNKYKENNLQGALDAQFKLTPIRNALDLASFPVGTKDIANIMGLRVGDPYKPNKSSNGEVIEKMKRILSKEGIKINS